MKLRKVLALTLAAAMTLSLTACGGSGEDAADAPAADDSAAAEETEAPVADEASDDGEETEAPAASSGLTYASVNLGEDYKDLTTTIKFIHHKTDREEDGTIPDLIAKFNEVYPGITVETALLLKILMERTPTPLHT